MEKSKFPFKAVFTGDNTSVNLYLDRKVSSAIESALDTATQEYWYSLSQLDCEVNEDETLREYLEDGIKEFNLNVSLCDVTTDVELNKLVQLVDDCWKEMFKNA